MGILNLKIYSNRPAAGLKFRFETPGAGDTHAIAQHILNFINSLQTGSESALFVPPLPTSISIGATVPPSIAISVDDNATPASATLTFTSVVNTNTFVVNGVTFTCVTSGATGNQFNVGVDDPTTAANAAAAINASVTALVAGYVVATAAAGVVTVTSAFFGTSGNQTTLVGSTNIVASSAKLTGGIKDPGAITISF